MLPTPIRFKLHFGPYRTPRFKIGAVVEDELHGDVKIVDLSDARIPWPVALNWRVRSLVVYRDLARAVRRESAQAVAHWWGVSIEKVRLIRRALGVPAINEGSKWLQKRFARSPEFRRMARMAWANAGSPERRAMARNAMLGKSQPEHVRRKIAAAKLGRIQSAATRRKIGAALKRNGTWRCWTAQETALLKKLLPQDAAERTGRSLRAVYNRRKRLGLSSILPRDVRFKLHLGAYRSPRFKYGAIVEDLLRGPVQIVGMSDAKIPWPIGKKGRAKSLILYKGLAKAVCKESHQAIRYWWGVGGNTVWRWRKALGVRPINEGTHRLKIRYGQEPFFKRAQRLAVAKARDPQRRAKIAASRLGKPRPPEVGAKIAAANRGRLHSEQAKRKMSLAHKRRGTWPPAAGRPWTKQEDAWLRAMRPEEVARRSGRTLVAVWSRRQAIGLPDGRVGRRSKSKARQSAC